MKRNLRTVEKVTLGTPFDPFNNQDPPKPKFYHIVDNKEYEAIANQSTGENDLTPWKFIPEVMTKYEGPKIEKLKEVASLKEAEKLYEQEEI